MVATIDTLEMASRRLDEEMPRASRDALSDLVGSLRVHVAHSEQVNPWVAEHCTGPLVAMARLFSADMAGLVLSFQAYAARWPSARIIADARLEFAAQTSRILGSLRTRIGREDTELYAAIDAAEGP